MSNRQERPLRLGQHWPPHVWLLAAADSELVNEKTDDRLKGQAPYREVNALERHVAGKAIVNETTTDLEVRRWIRRRRVPKVVVPEDPLIPYRSNWYW